MIDAQSMKKIIIIGPGGAGKTVFSRQLAELLHREVIHLDKHYWQPNWQRPEKGVWTHKVKQFLAGEEWIIDGNYKSTLDLRMAAADTVIFLNLPKWFCISRILWRRIQYHKKTRADLGGNNTEKISWRFLHWVANYPTSEVLTKLQSCQNSKRIIVLRSPSQIKRFLAEIAHAES